MSLDTLVDIQISVEASAPSRASFGVPLLMAYHDKWSELTREYSDIDGLVDDGFDSKDTVYKMAQALLSQNPHPTRFKVGRRASIFTQIFTLTPVDTTEDFVYKFTIEETEITDTVLSGDTVADIVGRLEALINAIKKPASTISSNKETYNLTDGMTLIVEWDGGSAETATVNTIDFVDIAKATAAELVAALNIDFTTGTASSVSGKVKLESNTNGVESSLKVTGGTMNPIVGFSTAIVYGTGALTAVDNTTHVTCTAVAGYLSDVNLQSMKPDDLLFADTTADPGIADDLDSLVNEDDDWYGLTIDSKSKVQILACAAWLETKTKIGVFSSLDSEILDSTETDDILSLLVASAYTRVLPMFSRHSLLNHRDVALMGEELAKDPGKSTWAFKTLAGIAVDTLTKAYFSTVQTKLGTTYTRIGGRNITFEGRTPANEFIDIPHFIDWLHGTMQEGVFALLAANDKVPYTDEGVETALGVIRSVLRQGVQRKGLRKDPTPAVTAPRVADVPLADRANRCFPDITFTAELAGALHKLVIRGKVTV